jgi:hypothetical protein
MALVEAAVATTHLLVGALWVGSVVFFAAVVLPLARAGALNAGPLERMATALTRWSRAASVLTLVTGAHLAAVGYTVDSLVSTTAGTLVVAMVVLWLGLTALVEAGSSRLRAGVERKKVREPAATALGVYRGAAAAGVLLLLTAGALAT